MIFNVLLSFYILRILNIINFIKLSILLFLQIVYRLEEKEQDMKQEYTKLHERYTELFKTHMDHIERTKILMGSGDRMDNPRSIRMPFMSMAHLNRYKIFSLKIIYK